MRLEKDAVDLFEVDRAHAVSDGLEQSRDAQVSRSPEQAFTRADDEVEGLGGEDAVGEGDAVELAEDPAAHVVGGELGELGGVGDAAANVLVDGEGRGVEQLWLAEEDELVSRSLVGGSPRRRGGDVGAPRL